MALPGLLTLFKSVCCPCSNWLVPIVIILLYKILEYVLKIWNPLGIQIGNKSEQTDATSDTEIEADECCSTAEKEEKRKKTE